MVIVWLPLVRAQPPPPPTSPRLKLPSWSIKTMEREEKFPRFFLILKLHFILERSDVLCSKLCSKLREGSTALCPPRLVICVGDFDDRQGSVSHNIPVHGMCLLRIIRSFLNLSCKEFPFLMPFLCGLQTKRLQSFSRAFSFRARSSILCLTWCFRANWRPSLPTIRAGCPQTTREKTKRLDGKYGKFELV